MTPKQRWKIQDLLRRLGWARVTVLQKLGESWELEAGRGSVSGRYWSPDIRTAQDASEIINILIGECRRAGLADR